MLPAHSCHSCWHPAPHTSPTSTPTCLPLPLCRWQCPQLKVLCLRERRGRVDPAASLCLEVALPELPPGFAPSPLGAWEPNERGKAGPRTADLAPAMNPAVLAESAVELNLRLMRWRAAPALDVGRIAGGCR